jgi:hypothetical protein
MIRKTLIRILNHYSKHVSKMNNIFSANLFQPKEYMFIFEESQLLIV